jgi:hypothetical protein
MLRACVGTGGNMTKLSDLRRLITESLRVQKGSETIDYINIGTAMDDACAKQNHTIFARRGCGKTLLLHSSTRNLRLDTSIVYLNCEDFKHHSFPNVLIEILISIFSEFERNLTGWFGKRKQTKDTIKGITKHLKELYGSADKVEESVRESFSRELTKTGSVGASLTGQIGTVKADIADNDKTSGSREKSYQSYRDKLQKLDRWLPELKRNIAEFFSVSKKIRYVFIQIDDLYHLRRADQAFVVDYIHRLCKDVPLFFKIATLRHASTLYLDRAGQPIGAQERHDYQPINIDYTFGDFGKTQKQNWQILNAFAGKAGMTEEELRKLFKGEGFPRLVMAGGGVPRDVLSLFLEVLGSVQDAGGDQIGKDDVRILSKANFERRIEELKHDSKGEEQGELLKGIYVIRKFCLEKATNIFLIPEKTLQQNRLMDYRIIHSCASALTHKSQEGTYQAFAIDIGCYAHFRKLQDKFNEIDVSSKDAKEKMRSSPILSEHEVGDLFKKAPENVEPLLYEEAA